jgi:alpha-1,3-rhamnosyltransferase
MNEPLISVIMASFNHASYLRDAIESVWQQSYSNIELVVVDDASTDGSLDLLKSLQVKSPIPMRIYSNEKNCGPAFTIASAFEQSKGELIAFLASDDVYAPNRFKKQVQCYLDDNNVLLTFADGLILYNNGNFGRNLHGNNVRDLLRKKPEEILRYLYTNSSPLFLQCSLVHRKLLNGAFDKSSLADDWLINISMFSHLAQDGKLVFVDQIVCYYRVHDANVHKNIERQTALKLQVIERYTPDNLRREALANIYWEIGMSHIFDMPLKSLRCLFVSQIYKPRPLLVLRLIQKGLVFMCRKLTLRQ